MKSKLVFVACFVICVACGTREQEVTTSTVDLTSRAQDFVIMLSQEDYAGCIMGFDNTMKEALPESKLSEAWNTIQTQVGSFQSQLGVRQTQEGGYDVVYVTCQFEKGKIDVKVVYNSKQEVTGLWFRPAK